MTAAPLKPRCGEAFLGRALHVGVDRQLDAAAFLRRGVSWAIAHLAAAAVDDDDAIAVAAHQEPVIGALDPVLPDHRSRLRRPTYSGRGEIGLADFAHVAEEVPAGANVPGTAAPGAPAR